MNIWKLPRAARHGILALVIALCGSCQGDHEQRAEQKRRTLRHQQRQQFDAEFKAALDAGRVAAAETLYAEAKTRLLDSTSKNFAAVALGNAFFNPGGTYPLEPGAPRRSVVSSRPTEARGCSSQGSIHSIRQPDAKKARAYFREGESYHYAADASYLARDLNGFDADMAAINAMKREPSAGQVAARTGERIRLLVNLERYDEALALAETASHEVREGRSCALASGQVVCTKPGEAEKRSYCHLWFAAARIHELRRNYAAARASYQQATRATSNTGCRESAQARREALESAKDGKPLPAFRVAVSIDRGKAKVKLRLVADRPPPTSNPNSLRGHDLSSSDPASLDYWDVLFALEAKADQTGSSFVFEQVPVGTWNIVVVAEGSVAFKPGDKCWPVAVVERKDVSVGTVRIVVDPSQGRR